MANVDEFPSLEVPPVSLWSENYAFTCNDASSGIGLTANLGRCCAHPDIWREAVTIALPDERIICIKNYGRNTTERIASAAMFEVDIIKEGEVVVIRYDGPAVVQGRATLLNSGFRPGPVSRCRFEIAFQGLTPVWNISGDTGHSTDIAGKMHIEQIGRGDGFIELDNGSDKKERFTIVDAFTNRDHSRGVRNLDAFKRSCWAQGYFPEDKISFSVYAIEMFGIEGLAMSNASVTQGERRFRAEVKDVELIGGMADAGRPFCVKLASELGEMELRINRTITSSPLSVVSPWDLFHGILPGVPSGLLLEESVIWSWGNREGAGWSERCVVHEAFSRFS